MIVKVPLKNAQEVLVWVKRNDFLNFNYEILKKDGFLFFSIKKEGMAKLKKEFLVADFTKLNLKKREKKETDIRKILSKHLSEEELNNLVTSYDVVGSIAILDIPNQLVRKQKIIADTLLKTQKNIKTVLKKAGIHSGKFRTQKLNYLAGIKTKETIHKENNISLKLNVEDVYFSTRSSTERKRVMNQVKKNESVLVMFSGCGPFTCSIAKNSQALNVFGIELNPVAHKYAVENIKLNKLNNTEAILGDVRKVIPDFYKNILGLKSDIQPGEIETRLVEQPKIFEFHLRLEDLFWKKERLEVGIDYLKKQGIDVVLHMPFDGFNGERLTLDKENVDEEIKVLSVLGELCKKYDIDAVVHPVQGLDSGKNLCNEELLVSNLKKLKKYFDHFMFENIFTKGCLFRSHEEIKRISNKAGIKNLVVDVCHCYLYYKSNKKIIDHIKALKDDFNLYFHLADTDGKLHGIEVGTGKINFDKILLFVKRGIVEVTSRTETNPIEMLASFEDFADRKKFFDRVVMPLPKSAESFLDVAFSASKKGTIIHLYLFLKDSEIPDKGEKIVSKAAKKYNKKVKILRTVKCGTYSPRTFRVCVDFKVLD